MNTEELDWGFYNPHKYLYSNCRREEIMSEEEMKRKIACITSTQELVDVYVESYFQYKFYEDAEYDFEEGSEEYESSCDETDVWREIMDYLEDRIKKTASEEGLLAEKGPDSGIVKQLVTFMDKYGYLNQGGWWVKKEV